MFVKINLDEKQSFQKAKNRNVEQIIVTGTEAKKCSPRMEVS